MTSLQKRLEALVAADRGGTYDTIHAHEARRVLALLAAAKKFHDADPLDTLTDNYYSTRDTLLNAIHAMEDA